MHRDLSKAELLAKAEELRVFAEKTDAKFDALRLARIRDERRYRFFSRDRKNFWQMPAYVWVPFISALVLLFLLSLYAVAAR